MMFIFSYIYSDHSIRCCRHSRESSACANTVTQQPWIIPYQTLMSLWWMFIQRNTEWHGCIEEFVMFFFFSVPHSVKLLSFDFPKWWWWSSWFTVWSSNNWSANPFRDTHNSPNKGQCDFSIHASSTAGYNISAIFSSTFVVESKVGTFWNKGHQI